MSRFFCAIVLMLGVFSTTGSTAAQAGFISTCSALCGYFDAQGKVVLLPQGSLNVSLIGSLPSQLFKRIQDECAESVRFRPGSSSFQPTLVRQVVTVIPGKTTQIDFLIALATDSCTVATF